MHGSTPNRSQETREAIATAVAPRGAELIHVVADGDRRRVYRIDRDFFLDVHPHDIAVHGLPDRYPLIEEFVESAGTAAPDAVAAVCDPSDLPVPKPASGEAPRQPLPPGERERVSRATSGAVLGEVLGEDPARSHDELPHGDAGPVDAGSGADAHGDGSARRPGLLARLRRR